MKMHKVKPKKDEYAIGGSLRKEESRPRYPTVRIGHEHLPEAKGWKPGDKKHVRMHLKMVGNSQSRFQNEGEYEIHKIGAEDGEEHEEGKAAEEDAEEDKKDVDDDTQREHDKGEPE